MGLTELIAKAKNELMSLLKVLLLLGAMKHAQVLPFRLLLLKVQETLLKHLDLVFKVSDLVPLRLKLMRLQLVSCLILLALRKLQFKCANFLQLLLKYYISFFFIPVFIFIVYAVQVR